MESKIEKIKPITHIYCNKCKEYYSFIKSNGNYAGAFHPCEHISLLTVESELVEINGPFTFVNITNHQIELIKKNKIGYKKCTASSSSKQIKRKAGEISYPYLLKNYLRTSTNTYFKGCTYYIKSVRSRADLSIKVKRVDYESANWRNGPTGIRKAFIAVSYHKTNVKPVIDGFINLYSKNVKLTKKQRELININTYVHVLDATWIRETSKSLYDRMRLQSGFIAYTDSSRLSSELMAYHSTISVEDAIIGLNRKVKNQLAYQTNFKKRERKKKERVVVSVNEIVNEFFSKNNIPLDFKITLRDSIRAGNCKIGTKDFAIKHSLSSFKKYSAFELLMKEPDNNFLKTTILHKHAKIDV